MKEAKPERDDRVTIAVRLDAISKGECESDVCVYVNDDNQTLHFSSPEQILDVPRNASFTFDKVFDDWDDELCVYEESVQPLVEYTMRGHDATVFCYGENQSNTESTPVHDTSMQNLLQSSSELLFHALADLVAYKESIANKTHVQLTLSVIEVHVDEMIDLLCSERKIVEYSHTSEEMALQGVTVIKVENIDDAAQHLEKIQFSRIKEKKEKNKVSACSHVLFFVDVLQSPEEPTQKSLESNTLPVPSSYDVSGAVSDSNVVTATNTKHSRFVFVELARPMCVEQTDTIAPSAAEVEFVNSTFTVLSRALTALYTHRKYNPYRKCMLTKLLRHTFTDRHSCVLLIGQITPHSGNAVSTLDTLEFCNNIKKLTVATGEDTNEQSINLQPYLQSQHTNEELVAELHILKEEHEFTPTNVHVLSQVRKEPIELTRQRVAEELKASLPTLKAQREAEEMHELELQAARECDEEVEEFVLHMNSLIEEYERVAKNIKTEKKRLKKEKEENDKGKVNANNMNDDNSNNNKNSTNKDDVGDDKERELKLLHEAKKAKKRRLKLEAEVKRLREEISVQQQINNNTNDNVASKANAEIVNETNAKQYYDEDIDSEINNEISVNNINDNIIKNVSILPTTAIAGSSIRSYNWDEVVHTLVSSFVESATEVNKLHVQYILRLLTCLRLRLRVKRLRISSSDIMTEGTLLADIIDFIITRAVHVAEKVVQSNSPWSWIEIDGRSTRLLSAQEMCPPLLTRNVVIRKRKHTHTNAGINNKLTSKKEDKELEQEEELFNSESERQHSDSLSYHHHNHRHHHRHSNQPDSTSTSALDNDVDSDKESWVNRTATSEIIEYDLTDPVEYHKITFLSSDESDDENSHHAAETRRAVMQSNMASFCQFSINESSNVNDNDGNNLDSHNNKHNDNVNNEHELEQITEDDTSTSKKTRKRRDEKKKHRRSKIDMASVEYASSNFAPLSMQHENEFEETADAIADSQNKMFNTEPLDTLDSNCVNTQNAPNNVLVNTLVSVNEADRNEHEEEQEEQKETRHKHRKRHHHHHHHHNDNNNHREDNNMNDLESGNATPVTQKSSSENTKTTDDNSTAITTRHSVPSVITVPPSMNMDSQLADKESNSQINNHNNNGSNSNNNNSSASSLSSSSSSVEAQGNSSTLASDAAKTSDETVSTNNQSANNEQQGNSSSTGVHPHPQRREDMCYLMQVYDSPTLVQDLLKFLRTGTPMIKHGRQGKPHKRLFWISTINNKRELLWMKQDGLGSSNGNNNMRSSINLSEVHYIQLGCFSKVFKRNPISSNDPAFFRCFTLGLRNNDRTIDVVAESVPDFEAWVVGLAHLVGVDPAWGGKLDVTKDPTFTHLTFFESSLCESNYIQPRDYLIVKKTVQQRAAYTARVLSECGNDAKKAFNVLGGIHLPAIDSKGALYITKGELRFLIPQLCLDIFRITQIWILLQQMNLVFDDKFLPATAFGFTLR